MRILITNDDGWGTKGIWTLVEEMRKLGEVIVVADNPTPSACFSLCASGKS